MTATEVVLPGVVEPGGLALRERQLPPPATGQVLVRVEAERRLLRRAGHAQRPLPGPAKFPFVPGYDLIGTVHRDRPGRRTHAWSASASPP